MSTNTFTARAEITEGEFGFFNVALGRLNDEKLLPLTNFKNLSPSEIYVKFGIKVDVPPPPPTEAVAAAKSVLKNALDALPNSNLVSRERVVDMLLDTLSELGYEEEEEKTDEP